MRIVGEYAKAIDIAVCELSGDDRLAHADVLRRLDCAMSSKDVRGCGLLMRFAGKFSKCPRKNRKLDQNTV